VAFFREEPWKNSIAGWVVLTRGAPVPTTHVVIYTWDHHWGCQKMYIPNHRR